MSSKSAPLITSYELTLPQSIHRYLDTLDNPFKWEVQRLLKRLWSEESLNLLKGHHKASAVLKSLIPRPKHIQSRIHRNILEMTDQILRSQIVRKEVFDLLLQQKDVKEICNALDVSPYLVHNVWRQLSKAQGTNYFDMVRPSFSGGVIITAVDDEQFVRLSFKGDFALLDLKVLDGNKWQWIRVQKLMPSRLRKAIKTTKKVLAVSLKKVYLKNGYSIWRLVIPVEVQVGLPDEVERVFALDLSPSEKRLAVGVVVSREGHSKPVFFKAERVIRRLERLDSQVSSLKGRPKHLYQEQRLLHRKIKELRKQILETFVNLVIEHTKVYDCQAIGLEDLKFLDIPEWENKKLRRLFSQWFYIQAV